MLFSNLPTNTLSVRSTNNPFSNTPGILLIVISMSFGFLIPGVLENGLFVDLTDKVLVGKIEDNIPMVYSPSRAS